MEDRQPHRTLDRLGDLFLTREAGPRLRLRYDLPFEPAAPHDELDLPRFVLPDAVRLPLVCPDQPEAQFMFDESGLLHALLMHRGDELTESLSDLLDAGDWALDNRQFLPRPPRRVEPTRKRLGEIPPALHLFTSDAKPAVTMAERLRGSVKLYLLQQVWIADRSTWVCNALN